MVISILLLAVLFIAGLVNTFFYYLPTKNFQAWVRSFFTKTAGDGDSPVSSSAAAAAEGKETNKAELKRVFATFDKDGDGFITKQELKESLKNLMLMVTDRDAQEMVEKVDANGDGLIEFNEFCMLYDDMAGQRRAGTGDGDGDDSWKEAFDVFDKDKDGLISVEELGLVLAALGLNEGNKIESCREMIRRVDVDGDGMVDFDEFRMMMMMNPGVGVGVGV